MPKVEFTTHLFAYFPVLREEPVVVAGETVAEVVRNVDALAPGFAFYVAEEDGALRTHVNIFVNNEMVVDRNRLGDRVKDSDTVFVMQALSGG